MAGRIVRSILDVFQSTARSEGKPSGANNDSHTSDTPSTSSAPPAEADRSIVRNPFRLSGGRIGRSVSRRLGLNQGPPEGNPRRNSLLAHILRRSHTSNGPAGAPPEPQSQPAVPCNGDHASGEPIDSNSTDGSQAHRPHGPPHMTDGSNSNGAQAYIIHPQPHTANGAGLQQPNLADPQPGQPGMFLGGLANVYNLPGEVSEIISAS